MQLYRIPGVIVALFLCAVTWSLGKSEDKILAKGLTEGTFFGIEQGDYAHFQLKNKAGEEESYFLLRPDKSSQPYLDHPEKFEGKKVRVSWEEKMQMIPEAGERMRIKVVWKVEALGK